MLYVGCMCHGVHVENSLRESLLSFLCVGPRVEPRPPASLPSALPPDSSHRPFSFFLHWDIIHGIVGSELQRHHHTLEHLQYPPKKSHPIYPRAPSLRQSLIDILSSQTCLFWTLGINGIIHHVICYDWLFLLIFNYLPDIWVVSTFWLS